MFLHRVESVYDAEGLGCGGCGLRVWIAEGVGDWGCRWVWVAEGVDR